MNATTTYAARLDELRATIETWRAEARATCYEIDNAIDVEWLSGRVCALNEVLSLLDGTPPPVALREHLLPAD